MSPIGIGPQRRGILLWRWQYTWQPQTNAGVLLFFGVVLLFISSIFLGLMGNYVYRAHRLASEGKFATGTVVKKVMHPASDNGTSDCARDLRSRMDPENVSGGGNRKNPAEPIRSSFW